MEEAFENNQIFPISLPSTTELDYQQLDRKNLTQLRVAYFLFSIIIFIGVLFILTASKKLLDWKYFLGSMLGLVLFTALTFLYAKMIYKRRKYALRQKDISYKSGVLISKMVTIPFNRIQHCDISRGLMDQYFDLSKLNIYTAGGASSDITIPGLPLDVADRLKSFILKKTSREEEE